MFQIKPSMVKYKPVGVKTILEDVWKYASTAIDPAFYTYFAKERELATKVLELDKHITENIAQFILHNSMAYGRTRKRCICKPPSFLLWLSNGWHLRLR
jgi:uncharacterized protein with PhoU and TrkA domain